MEMLQTKLIFQYNHQWVQCICDIFPADVNSTRIEIFCVSLQQLFDSFLERLIVRTANNTKVRLQIAEQNKIYVNSL